MTDLELVQRMLRRAADAVAERFSEDTRFAVDGCVRTIWPHPVTRCYVLQLVLRNPPSLRAEEGVAAGEVLWEVSGPSANGAVVRFRRRLAEVKRPPVPRRRSS